MKGFIHSTESFGTVDGPGIRYVVFMQGCPMRCLYCHNPDTWAIGKGKVVTTDEILREYEKCRPFLKNGGLTVTGGEPLLQMDFIIELFQKAKQKDIHTCIDTSGITFREVESQLEKMDELLKVTDLILLDIKHINSIEHKKLTGLPNDHILNFAAYLDKKEIPVWIRHVVVPGYTDKEEYLDELGYYLGGLKNIKALDVLPYHTMGKVKYDSMRIEYPLEGVEALSKDKAVWAKEIILSGMKRRLLEERQKNA